MWLASFLDGLKSDSGRARRDQGRRPERRRRLDFVPRLEPTNGVFLNTLAAVQYRLGNYDQALATLVRAELLNGARFDGPWPRDLALRAVIQIQLGQTEPARATLDRLCDVLKSPRWSDAVEAKNWQREVEALILEKSAPDSKKPAEKN